MVHITLGKSIRKRKDHPETAMPCHAARLAVEEYSVNLYLGSPSKVPVFAHGMGFSIQTWLLRRGFRDADFGWFCFEQEVHWVCRSVCVCLCFFDVENRPNAFGRFLGTQLGTEMKTFPSSQKSGLGRWPLHLDDFFCPKFGSIMYLNKTDLPSLQLTVCTWKFVIPVSFWESLFQGGYSLSLG